MKTTETKLTPKQEQAILALLNHPTTKAAGEACGTSETTLWRWMQETEFMKRLRAAQREVVNAAIGALQGATVEAVETLRRNLSCGNFFAENTAAKSILEMSMKAVELESYGERIARLEELFAQKEGQRQWR